MPPTANRSSSPTGSSASLVARLQAFDTNAWQRLSELYGPEVYGWARRAGLQDSNAADVMQEVFQTVVRQIAGFRRERPGDSFRGWLWGIAQHKILDQFRRTANQPNSPGGSEFYQKLAQLAEASAEGATPAEEIVRLARRALALIRSDFEPTTWQAFERSVLDGATAAQIAAELGISRGAVYTAKCRVLARLRQELADPLE